MAIRQEIELRRIILFISSYIPLYILLIIKNILERCTIEGHFSISIARLRNAHFFDEINDYAIVVLSLLSIGSYLYLRTITKKDSGIHYYEVKDVEDQTGSVYFNYISVYLLSCLGLSLNRIVDVFTLIFLMILVGYIYISNHMTYMNPVLQFMGFKIYDVTVLHKSTGKEIASIIISPVDIPIKTGESYCGSGKEDFISMTGKCE